MNLKSVAKRLLMLATALISSNSYGSMVSPYELVKMISRIDQSSMLYQFLQDQSLISVEQIWDDPILSYSLAEKGTLPDTLFQPQSLQVRLEEVNLFGDSSEEVVLHLFNGREDEVHALSFFTEENGVWSKVPGNLTHVRSRIDSPCMSGDGGVTVHYEPLRSADESAIVIEHKGGHCSGSGRGDQFTTSLWQVTRQGAHSLGEYETYRYAYGSPLPMALEQSKVELAFVEGEENSYPRRLKLTEHHYGPVLLNERGGACEEGQDDFCREYQEGEVTLKRGFQKLPFLPVVSEEVTTVSPGEAVKTISALFNQNGLALLHTLRQKQQGNLLLSPYSLGVAMMMVHSAASGETRNEIGQLLGLDSIEYPQESLMSALLQQSKRFQDDDEISIELANALVLVQEGMVQESYRTLLKKNYEAELFSAGGVEPINQWVEEKSRGKITNMLSALDPNAAAVLLNALYFKAPWSDPFEPMLTRNQPFYHGTATSTKVVPIMQKSDDFRLLNREGYRALEIPYGADESLSMVVLLPEQLDGLSSLEQRMDGAELEALFEGLRDSNSYQRVALSLPRFKMESNITMKEVYQQLGLMRPFGEQAEFERMTGRDDPGVVRISSIIHKSVVEVDEQGSEAAAATAITFATRSGGVFDERKPVEFKVDHPFLFLLLDRNSDTILFVGSVVAPEAITESGVSAQTDGVNCSTAAYITDGPPHEVSVKEGPDGKEMTRLPTDTMVTVIAYKDGWIKIGDAEYPANDQFATRHGHASNDGWVSLSGLDGWVPAHSLETSVRNYDPQKQEWLLSENRATSNKSVMLQESESSVTLVVCHGEWLKVRYRDDVGWLRPELNCPSSVTTCP